MTHLFFKDDHAFWTWLNEHHKDDEGYWIKFDKLNVQSSFTAEQALDIALCFGWIDGQIKRLDDQFYVKYFSKRRVHSIWSTKNKKSIERLSKKGLIMPSGWDEVNRAKQDGRWDKADLPPVDYDLDSFDELLKPHHTAYENYHLFSPSIRKTYAMSYFVLKKQESRDRRLSVIIERLEKKLKPM